jgi:hypothetical protein
MHGWTHAWRVRKYVLNIQGEALAPRGARIEPGTEDLPPKLVRIKKMDNIFVKIYELAEEIHMDQTGAFPVTSQ